MMRITMFSTADPQYGGSRYEQMVSDVLSERHNVSVYDVRPRFMRFAQRPQVMLRTVWRELGCRTDVFVRNELSTISMADWGRTRLNVSIMHHFDPRIGPSRLLSNMFEKALMMNLKKCDRVIAVSEFWRDHLRNQGVENCTVIHNAFNVQDYDITEEEKFRFMDKHGLRGKPIIYIGNCQRLKGVVIAYEALSSMDAHFVTSGLKDVELPCLHLTLDHREYKTLLAVSSVCVLMSIILEGWNRTAHEAMLCKTPVVGSGAGGMRELLAGGGQLVCSRPEDLPSAVEYAMRNRDRLGDAGYAFAARFTTQRFRDAWEGLMHELETYGKPVEEPEP
ncbi:glycosyltransferase family 4 protein [Desulfocurvibacter africanus]|uniref:glycosyltransferase family 4 protein n=1 Tax=Desulfocurvibacter africanus TaxID=873 RepID=UPI002FD8928C